MTALPHGLISQRAVRHSAMWRCRKEKDNSLTVLTEREGGEEGGREAGNEMGGGSKEEEEGKHLLL